jgi:hypothetical protein
MRRLSQSLRLFWLALFVVAPVRLHAAIQFDIFPGYEAKLARAGAWYPVGFEVFNDGPSFQGVIEIRPDTFSGTVQQIPIDLPNNTRKRLTVARFCGSASGFELSARLLDEKGKVRAESPRTQVRVVGSEVALVGAMPGAYAGMPALPEVKGQPEGALAVARLDAGFFPDDPLQLEALNAIYLNTARALELKEPQSAALLTWLHLGGHLVVVIDQTADLAALPWLRGFLPGVPVGETNAPIWNAVRAWTVAGPSFDPWVYSPGKAGLGGDTDLNPSYSGVPADSLVGGGPAALYTLRPSDGLAPDGSMKPAWALSAARGRGRLTLLAFNPEREPFKASSFRPWFWARLAGVPSSQLRGANEGFAPETAEAGLASMVETKQVRKLPLEWLLLLLAAYLIVIGPFDYWWLRKIKRPMLTWVTFPSYVILFSVLIYFIGFKLRSGQTEWNELHFVDVVPQSGGRAALRGRMIGSLYSPQNRTYRLAGEAAHAAARPMTRNLFTGTSSGSRLSVGVFPRKVEADLFVPVWTSEPFVLDWQDFGAAPVVAAWTGAATLVVTNATQGELSEFLVVSRGRVHQFKLTVAPGASVKLDVPATGGVKFDSWAAPIAAEFQGAMAQQQSVFASGEKLSVGNRLEAAAAASFGTVLPHQGNGQNFAKLVGFDLGVLAAGPAAVVMAWQNGPGPLPPINHFPVIMSRSSVVYRLVVPSGRL